MCRYFVLLTWFISLAVSWQSHFSCVDNASAPSRRELNAHDEVTSLARCRHTHDQITTAFASQNDTRLGNLGIWTLQKRATICGLTCFLRLFCWFFRGLLSPSPLPYSKKKTSLTDLVKPCFYNAIHKSHIIRLNRTVFELALWYFCNNWGHRCPRSHTDRRAACDLNNLIPCQFSFLKQRSDGLLNF